MTNSKPILQQAQHWLSLGIATIPIRHRDKRPALPAWRKYQTTLPTDGELRAWFNGRLRNLGVVAGWAGLTVLDFDSPALYHLWYTWATLQGGVAATVAECTYRVLTARGVHVYVGVDDRPRCTRHDVLQVDVKGRGGYVLAPPSMHPSGAQYTCLDAAAPIVRVGTLAEVLPLPTPTSPPRILSEKTTEITESYRCDPWEAAAAPVFGNGSGDLVGEIKSAISILELLPAVGGRGRWRMARCPFHDDGNPSMWIDTERGLCGCYAGCTPKPLDVINLHARLHNLENGEAVRGLAELLL